MSKPRSGGYVKVFAPWCSRATTNGYVREHHLVAEIVLGKPLPPLVVVHHINGDKSDNRRENLVICQDAAYHTLLHERMKAYLSCGNAGFRRCSYCHEWSYPQTMRRNVNGQSHYHKDCKSLYDKTRVD